jgi:hypothetical protein
MSSNINNFKQLQQENELLFHSSGKSHLVEKGIYQKISMLQFFGTIAELYLPVFAETILEMTKGNDQDYHYSNTK